MYDQQSREVIFNHGSIEKNCLLNLLNKNSDSREENGPSVVKRSNYYDFDQFTNLLKYDKDFSLLSLNIQGLRQKIHELEVWVDKIREVNLNLTCLLIQETHLEKEVCDSIKLHGYSTLCFDPTVSKFGGLAVFMKEDIPFKELKFDFISEL